MFRNGGHFAAGFDLFQIYGIWDNPSPLHFFDSSVNQMRKDAALSRTSQHRQMMMRQLLNEHIHIIKCDFTEICYEDLDGDGYGTEDTIPSSDVDCDDESESGTSDDCDGTDPQTYPGATDELGDGIDQDCDGVDGTGGTTEPSSEPSNPSTEPSGESTEPSGEELPDKSSCSHISTQEGILFALLPLFGLLGRRR